MQGGMATSRVGIAAAGLDPEGYTALRLQHATPQHLHLTSRRFFVGPIPEGWLKTHRRDWYRHHLHINYSSRTATFSSSSPSDRRGSKQRRLTGLEGPSSSALFQHSFPQPEDLEGPVEEVDCGRDTDGVVGTSEAASERGASSKKIAISPSQGQVTQKEIVASPQSDMFVDAESEPESEDDDGGVGEEDLSVYTHQEEIDAPDQNTAIVPRPRARTQSSTKSYVTASSSPGVIGPDEGDASGAEDLNDRTRVDMANDGNFNAHAENAQAKPTVAANHAETEGQASGLQVQDSAIAQGKRPVSTIDSSHDGARAPSADYTSATSLLRNTDKNKAPGRLESKLPPRGILTKIRGLSDNGESSDAPTPLERAGESLSRRRSNLRNLVKFDIPEDSKRASIHLRAKQAQMTVQRASSKLKRRKIKDGLVVKMERMLVRVDATAADVPDEYDENANQKIESRVKDKWREYMVVCRHSSSDDADFVLQMYKTRVIPEIENPNASKRAAFQIPLGRKISKVNLYSSLDKSVVVCKPDARGTGTLIFIMQARTASNAVEWYTFLRNIMGWRRSSELQIHVPDMSISLRIADPFKNLEASQMEAQEATDSDNEEAILKTMQEERAVAQSLIRKCLDQLKDAPEWADVLESWTKNQLIGLAWKRYDRLEWIYGANERKMYGTIAMAKSHDLELRPKSHYPTTAVTRKKHITLTEPVPVEGFLIRLTSQRGQAKRLGLMFHKQLYFASHDQFFTFSRPTNATPPPPPKLRGVASRRVRMDTGGSGFSASSVEQAPDTWEINPYPVKDGQVEWLTEGYSGTPESARLLDEEAADEADRKAYNLLNCDGYINLANVVKVRKAKKGASPVDGNIESGSDVDFDEVNDDSEEDGVTTDLDMHRTFELVMKNGLIIRLQAADKTRRKQWITHLRALVKYWKFRTQADIALYKSTRARNLSALNIDEEGESYIGQFAKKWEVTQSYASPLLYNMCGIGNCRTIHMSGTLYRKPRIHAPFTRCSVLLTSGTLILFQDVLRSRTGKQLAHIHHERIANLDLRDCYIYSGLLTESDLLYQNQTFDSNKPGHHALPRIYLDAGGVWTSTDEDVMTTFVVWHGKSKSWFRSTQEGAGGGGEQMRQLGKRGKLKRVAKLGSKGRSLVFRARSRAERDRWVLALKNEIERLGGGLVGGEDVRIGEGEGGQ